MSWGWLVGPLAWLGCAWVTARVVGLEPAPTLVRALLAGLVSLLAVIVGQHWLGLLVAVGLFAYLCAREPGGAGGMDLGLEGRVALVMGASRGIGRAIAAALAREGAQVAIASRSAEKLEEAAAEIGEAATPFVADASDLDRLAALPGEVAGALGPVEILVANTGGPPFGGALDHELDEWEAAYRSLVLAPRVLAGAVAAGNARAWLGPDRQRRLQLHPRADPRPQPLQRPPDGRGRLPQDALARGRRRRDHRQHGRHRPLRHRTPGRRGRLARGAPKRRRSAKSRPAASASRRSTAT